MDLYASGSFLVGVSIHKVIVEGRNNFGLEKDIFFLLHRSYMNG